MLPLELAHYDTWALRLETALQAAYPRTLWFVLHPDEGEHVGLWCVRLPWDGAPLTAFRLIAVKAGTRCFTWEDVPFTLVVDEEAFPMVVVALGRELERRLAAIMEER